MDTNKHVISPYKVIAKKYSELYFDDTTDFPFVLKCVSTLPEHGNILDVGCGPGTFTHIWKDKGFNIEGIDISDEMILIARKKVPNVNFSVADMKKLPYKQNSFDGVFAGYSLIHIPSDEVTQTLRGFHKVLKPGGKMMTIVQSGEPDRIVDEPLATGNEIFMNFFTKERLSNFLGNAGFFIEYMEEQPIHDADALSESVIYSIATKQ